MFLKNKSEFGTVKLKEKSKHKNIFTVLALIFFVVSALVAVYLINKYEILKVKKVIVEGNKVTEPSLIISSIIRNIIASSKLKAMIGPENILFWLGKIPASKSMNQSSIAAIDIAASIRRKTVLIKTSERKLWGIWCGNASSSSCVGIDSDGLAFIETPEPEGFLIMKIVSSENTPRMNSSILPSQKFNFLKSVIEEIAALNLQPEFLEIKARNMAEWSLQTSNGPKLLFSTEFQPENLMNVVAEIKKTIAFDSLNILDFRVKDKVYYR